MNIIIVNPLLRYMHGGAEVNDVKLGESLRKLGHNTVHIDVYDPTRPESIYDFSLPVESVHMPFYFSSTRIQWNLKAKYYRQIFFWDFLYRLYQQKKSCLKYSDLILLTGKPLLSLVNRFTNSIVLQSVRGPTNRWGLPLIRYSRSGIIFWGGSELDHDQSKLKDIPHIALNPSVEKELFYCGPAKKDVREKLSLYDNEAVVLTYVGRLDQVNQVDYVIRAAAHVSSIAKICLNIVGEGSECSRLEALADDLALKRVIFHGRQTRDVVADILRATDIFVMYPRWNNHPIALMEAISCGSYAIAPETGRIPNLMNNAFGVMIEGNSQKSLDVALSNAINEKAWQKEPSGDNNLEGISSWLENAEAIVNFAGSL